jgi:hypothetical protein
VSPAIVKMALLIFFTKRKGEVKRYSKAIEEVSDVPKSIITLSKEHQTFFLTCTVKQLTLLYGLITVCKVDIVRTASANKTLDIVLTLPRANGSYELYRAFS